MTLSAHPGFVGWLLSLVFVFFGFFFLLARFCPCVNDSFVCINFHLLSNERFIYSRNTVYSWLGVIFPDFLTCFLFIGFLKYGKQNHFAFVFWTLNSWKYYSKIQQRCWQGFSMGSFKYGHTSRSRSSCVTANDQVVSTIWIHRQFTSSRCSLQL